MKEALYKIINSYILPTYPNIKIASLSQVGSGDKVMYVILIRHVGLFEKDDRDKILTDVRQLFTSMGFSNDSDFMISYSKLG